MKRLYLFSFILLATSCTGPIRNYLSPHEEKPGSTQNTATAKPSVIPSHESSDISSQKPVQPVLTFPVTKWPGKEFIILEKQQMFNHLGYELFFYEDPSIISNAPDTIFELPNHRLRCDKYTGIILKVQTVTPKKNEWLVAFKDPLSGKTIYGTTHKNAIKEIAPLDDIKSALNRWKGSTIFSHKGVISTSNPDGSFGSLKVRFQDSLHVYDIQWGVTPLPVNPLWIMVKTTSGKKGFIPTRISWTNIMNDRKKVNNPWDDDLFEQNPEKIYSWDDYTWEVINNHRIIIEMTPQQVLLSWGEPVTRLREPYQGTKRECWKYNLQKIYFDKNGVIAVEENRY